jgi:hypothetical protein
MHRASGARLLAREADREALVGAAGTRTCRYERPAITVELRARRRGPSWHRCGECWEWNMPRAHAGKERIRTRPRDCRKSGVEILDPIHPTTVRSMPRLVAASCASPVW